MFRVHQMYVKRDPNSKISIMTLEKVAKEKLFREATEIKISTSQEDLRVKIVVRYPFYLELNNYMVRVFNQDGLTIKKAVWEEKGSKNFRMGVLELTVS